MHRKTKLHSYVDLNSQSEIVSNKQVKAFEKEIQHYEKAISFGLNKLFSFESTIASCKEKFKKIPSSKKELSTLLKTLNEKLEEAKQLESLIKQIESPAIDELISMVENKLQLTDQKILALHAEIKANEVQQKEIKKANMDAENNLFCLRVDLSSCNSPTTTTIPFHLIDLKSLALKLGWSAAELEKWSAIELEQKKAQNSIVSSISSYVPGYVKSSWNILYEYAYSSKKSESNKDVLVNIIKEGISALERNFQANKDTLSLLISKNSSLVDEIKQQNALKSRMEPWVVKIENIKKNRSACLGKIAALPSQLDELSALKASIEEEIQKIETEEAAIQAEEAKKNEIEKNHITKILAAIASVDLLLNQQAQLSKNLASITPSWTAGGDFEKQNDRMNKLIDQQQGCSMNLKFIKEEADKISNEIMLIKKAVTEDYSKNISINIGKETSILCQKHTDLIQKQMSLEKVHSAKQLALGNLEKIRDKDKAETYYQNAIAAYIDTISHEDNLPELVSSYKKIAQSLRIDKLSLEVYIKTFEQLANILVKNSAPACEELACVVEDFEKFIRLIEAEKIAECQIGLIKAIDYLTSANIELSVDAKQMIAERLNFNNIADIAVIVDCLKKLQSANINIDHYLEVITLNIDKYSINLLQAQELKALGKKNNEAIAVESKLLLANDVTVQVDKEKSDDQAEDKLSGLVKHYKKIAPNLKFENTSLAFYINMFECIANLYEAGVAIKDSKELLAIAADFECFIHFISNNKMKTCQLSVMQALEHLTNANIKLNDEARMHLAVKFNFNSISDMNELISCFKNIQRAGVSIKHYMDILVCNIDKYNVNPVQIQNLISLCQQNNEEISSDIYYLLQEKQEQIYVSNYLRKLGGIKTINEVMLSFNELFDSLAVCKSSYSIFTVMSKTLAKIAGLYKSPGFRKTLNDGADVTKIFDELKVFLYNYQPIGIHASMQHASLIAMLYSINQLQMTVSPIIAERIEALLCYEHIISVESIDKICEQFLISARCDIKINESLRVMTPYIDSLDRNNLSVLLFACFLHDANASPHDQVPSEIVDALLKQCNKLFSLSSNKFDNYNEGKAKIVSQMFLNEKRFLNNSIKDVMYHRYFLQAAHYYQFFLTQQMKVYLENFISLNDEIKVSDEQQFLYDYLKEEFRGEDITIALEKNIVAGISADILVVNNVTKKTYVVEYDGAYHYYNYADFTQTRRQCREDIARDKILVQNDFEVYRISKHDFGVKPQCRKNFISKNENSGEYLNQFYANDKIKELIRVIKNLPKSEVQQANISLSENDGGCSMPSVNFYPPYVYPPMPVYFYNNPYSMFSPPPHVAGAYPPPRFIPVLPVPAQVDTMSTLDRKVSNPGLFTQQRVIGDAEINNLSNMKPNYMNKNNL